MCQVNTGSFTAIGMFKPHMNTYTVKKVTDFPVPSRDVTTKLYLAGNNLIIPGQGEFG
jgi:hypothetical protein